MNQTLIIVPTYNERENLPRMVEKLLSLPVGVDMLVVDDNSPDGTGKLADELATKHPQVHVLHRTEKNGLGRAYIAGFKWALERKYEFIFEMDCDFSHDPDEIPAFLKAAENADLVLGSRYVGGIRVINWPLKRLLLSRFAGKYVAAVTGMPITDPTGGYKCFRRRALQALNLDKIECCGYGFQIELTHKLWRAGFTVVETPITFLDRTRGISKMTGGIANEAFWLVWRLWAQNGFRRSPRRKVTPAGSNSKLNVLLTALLLAVTSAFADMPKAGDTAPLFIGKDQDGKEFKLADHIGKKIVLLYFYPKDFTGGCTKEACGFRDRMGDLQTNNVEVIGVSHDSVESHKKFADEYKLNFTLIADPEFKIISAYDTKMNLVPMSRRVSFLIGLDGKIIHVTDAMSAQVHLDEMKEAIATLKK